MKPGVKTIRRQIGLEILDVRCRNDIVEYQMHMDGVDRGVIIELYVPILLIWRTSKTSTRKYSWEL